MLGIEEEDSYFRAVVSDAVKTIMNGRTAYCFQQEQVDTIKKVLLEKHKVKDIFVYTDEGIFYLTKKKVDKQDE